MIPPENGFCNRNKIYTPLADPRQAPSNMLALGFRCLLLATLRFFGSLLLLFTNDASDGYEFVAFIQVDQLHALGIAAGDADIFAGSAHSLAVGSAEHHFVGIGDTQGADDGTDFIGGLHRDDAFAAARLDPVFVERDRKSTRL